MEADQSGIAFQAVIRNPLGFGVYWGFAILGSDHGNVGAQVVLGQVVFCEDWRCIFSHHEGHEGMSRI